MKSNGELNADRVLDALRSVPEPELEHDIVTLQMVKNLKVSGSDVSMSILMAVHDSPHKPAIEAAIRAALARLGVERVDLVWGTAIPAARGQSDKAPLPGIKNIIAVGSGKGGVGKTTVAVNIAVGLARAGAAVGLLDADVYGPNVPLMMGATGQPHAIGDQIPPLEQDGMPIMSMGFLSPGDKPVIWRGPMLHSVMQQFLKKVVWGELDYLVVDLPPGTGDVQLSLIQTVPHSGAVVVTTPSDVSLDDARKAVLMFQQVKVDVLGVVENMSFLLCPHCHERVDVFGYGGGRRMAERFSVPFLGELPLNPEVRVGGDTGRPAVLRGSDDPLGKFFVDLSRRVAARQSVLNLTKTDGDEPILHVKM